MTYTRWALCCGWLGLWWAMAGQLDANQFWLAGAVFLLLLRVK